ncbi:LacI family transcriptional regulator [Fictibacillus sp. WQ 8-8]|uniref:LacI family DNA-binding transcriptional regulator n=1 Tax=unclassified Fictibacillus TaxID=2644029 RepID=UPI00210D5B87|nr:MULTISPECIES: LacI family DNA-binding transcriptional regulator [unclassified Fictibacillus]MCQ6267930.1 LacI family transcriptional regulator [Fictibacillus sp. WQ 8-8]MED2974403.1 LacI family DNA-binding transcriptional regulator [Fictibacillus sp. B-59209]
MTTIKDIAKRVGLSITTVSRALNDYYDVSEKTKQRVKQAARDLNYSPNSIARSLVMKKTRTIGLLVSEMFREGVKDNFTYEVLCGINDCSGQHDYDLVLFSTSSAKQKVKTYAQVCRERRVDGVIISGIKTNDTYLKEVVTSDIPCVLIDIPIRSDKVGFITTDSVLGAKTAVEYLIELGHKNIGFMNGHDFAFVSKNRLEGYSQALLENEIIVRSEWIANGAFSEVIAEEKALQMLQNHPEITAIFCASDLMALGVIRAAKKLNLQMPDELSIIGYDDIVLASYVTPALTTISQDKYQMGYQAAEMLISILENQVEPHQRVLNSKLVIRESTASIL